MTDAIKRWRASSIATQPPSEFPATCGVVTPSSSSRPATAAASAAGDGSPGSGADSPKPGRSTAMTSKWRASAGATGSQAWRDDPSGCRSTSGSPDPERRYASDVMTVSSAVPGTFRRGHD